MEVWSKLPGDVVESILSRLTVFDILRAGSTCTTLRAFVSSQYASISSSSLIVFVQGHSSAWAYDGDRDAWLKLSLAFLGPSFPGFARRPVASAGGLLCFRSGLYDFIICNPISRSWRNLPSLPRTFCMENNKSFHVHLNGPGVTAFGLMCDSITDTYDFFIMYHPYPRSDNGVISMHYSSSLSQWQGLPPFLSGVNLNDNNIISCNSRLYTLWDKGDNFMVFAYSDNIWTEIESPDCTPSELFTAFLMDSHGSLHMVGAVGAPDDEWERPASICIWKLHAESNEWMEVTRMPSSILQEFHTYIDLQCVGKNGVLYIKSPQSDVLMFDFDKIEWKWLKDMGMKAIFTALSFEPSLSASV